MNYNKIDEKLAAIYHEIVHWDLMSKGKMQHGDKRPLCNIYLQADKEECHDCPIFLRTRRHLCKGINYYERYLKEAIEQERNDWPNYFKHRAAGDFRDWLKDLYIVESAKFLKLRDKWKEE